MRRPTQRGVLVISIAILTGCGSAAVCNGNVGPETLTVDGSAYMERPDVVGVEVCVVPDDWDRDLATCSAPGVPNISYTTPDSDYPAVWAFYATVRTGESNFVVPEDGGGTQRLSCTATTTDIILPLEP